MEIKDIAVSVERLDEVRGGQYIDVHQAALQVAGNKGFSAASSYGVGNTTSSSVTQIAPQVLSQNADVNAVEIDTYEKLIANSVIDFGFGFPA